jgi:phage tail-like protein
MAALVAASALPLSASAQTLPPTTTAAHFVLSINGTEISSFGELASIQSPVEQTNFISIAPNSTIQTRQFGMTTPPTVTLKRGSDDSSVLWRWHEQVLMGSPTARKNADLLVEDASGHVLTEYVLEAAWPSKLEISSMQAGSSDIVYETVTLEANRIEVQ